MTPETLAALGGLLDKYGLPLAILVGLSWALLTRRLTLGSETNYVEARRIEEREGRLKAEATVESFGGSIDKLADGQESMADTLLTAFEEGPRGRQ